MCTTQRILAVARNNFWNVAEASINCGYVIFFPFCPFHGFVYYRLKPGAQPTEGKGRDRIRREGKCGVLVL
jgi:hypothetical protein